MKRNYAGCAICDSTWGDVWEEIDGERMFFCCARCATQFRHLVDRVKAATGWSTIDALDIAGDRRGRSCTAFRASSTFRCVIAFNAQGDVRAFATIP